MDPRPGSVSCLSDANRPEAADRLPVRVNNFDLIRLLAATQVLILHATEHLDAERLRPLAIALWYFPGVPIFFVISGYLISISWERAPSLRQYLWNRLLRIYPALWVCLAFSVMLFLLAGVRPPPGSFMAWLAAQLTIVQFYNPAFLRGFGTGVVNGSLWTITVELQFYFLLPLLALLVARTRVSWWLLVLVSLGLLFLARGAMGDQLALREKLVAVTLLPYLFFFLVGIIARQLYETIPALFDGKGLYWFGAYLLWIGGQLWLAVPGAGGNQLNPLSIVLLGFATVSLAFTKRRLSARLLHGNDISYGVYIYHMPIVNILIVLGVTGVVGVLAAFAATTYCALLSWHLVEKPALGLKAYSARW